MSATVKFPLTNLELAEAGGDAGPVYFPATFAEYWELLETAGYRVDYFDGQIIASMSYRDRTRGATSMAGNGTDGSRRIF